MDPLAWRAALAPLADGAGRRFEISQRDPLDLLLLLALILLDLLVIAFVLRSRKRTTVKMVWVLVVAFLPVLGLILYVLLGRERPR